MIIEIKVLFSMHLLVRLCSLISPAHVASLQPWAPRPSSQLQLSWAGTTTSRWHRQAAGFHAGSRRTLMVGVLAPTSHPCRKPGACPGHKAG